MTQSTTPTLSPGMRFYREEGDTEPDVRNAFQSWRTTQETWKKETGGQAQREQARAYLPAFGLWLLVKFSSTVKLSKSLESETK